MRVILSILLFVATMFSNAQTVISLNGNTYAEATMPRRNVEEVDDGIIVTYYFDNAITQQDLLYPECTMWKIPGFGVNEVVGEPAIPFRWDSFSVPSNTRLSIEIIDTSYIDFAMQLSPARPVLFENDTIGYDIERIFPVLPYDGYFPRFLINSIDGNDYRGHKILKIKISPLSYNYKEQILRVYKKVQYKISFLPVYTYNETTASIDRYDTYFQHGVINHLSFKQDQIKNNRSFGTFRVNRDYLILTTSELELAANHFAEWKKTLGFRTHVRVIPKNTTSSTIKNIIQSFYNEDDINLYYLLIIGTDSHVLPIRSTDILTTLAGPFYTDFYYSCMGDENDFTPDISIGRIPAEDLDEAFIMINKIISYEKEPVIDESFYKTGVHCAFYRDIDTIKNYEDESIVYIAEEIRNYMNLQGKDIKRVYRATRNSNPLCWHKSPPSCGDSIPMELRKPNFKWDATANDINKCINEGAFYFFYRGHGTSEYWTQPKYEIKEIDSLHNAKMLPVIFSICCSTGAFDGKKNLAETFLSKQEGGCVAIFAATSSSFRKHNNILAEGMFNAIWPNPGLYIEDSSDIGSTFYSNPTYELGQILNIGMSRVESYCSVSGTRTQKELFHCFGDPSMQIYTDYPTSIQDPEVCRIGDTIFVKVKDGEARIAFYTPSSNQVDTYYGTNVNYQTVSDDVVICISRHNNIPYITHSNKLVYIQNEIINNSRDYIGENVKVGRNVTDKKVYGDVIVNNGNVSITGKRVELQSGTKITQGAVLKINNL